MTKFVIIFVALFNIYLQVNALCLFLGMLICLLSLD